MARACVVMTVAWLALLALNLLAIRQVAAAVGAAVGAAAFAANLRAPSRGVHAAALAFQALTMLGMAAALGLVLSIAEAGRRGWDEMPGWAWLVVTAAFAVVGVAITEGVRVYRDA